MRSSPTWCRESSQARPPCSRGWSGPARTVSPPPSPSSCSSTPRTCSTCGGDNKEQILKGQSHNNFLHFPLHYVFSQDPVWKHPMDKYGPAGSKACLNHCLFNHYWNIRKPTMDVSLFLPEIKYLMSYVLWSYILMVKKGRESLKRLLLIGRSPSPTQCLICWK